MSISLFQFFELFVVGEEEGEGKVVVFDGEAETVGAGGVGSSEVHHVVEEGGLLSPQGHAEPFDADDHFFDQ